MTLVVNLYGSAGSGKSTTALGLCYVLRLMGYKAEYVSEYAKDVVSEGSLDKLKHQLYVFSKQLKRMEVLKDKDLDFIITDSPLIMSLFYGIKYKTAEDYLKDVVMTSYNSFNNFDVFLTRAVTYDPILRLQSEEESDQDSKDLLKLLEENINIDLKTTSKKELLLPLIDSILSKSTTLY